MLASAIFLSTATSQATLQVCERSDADILNMLHDRDNRLTYGNQGGLLNGGVCWWHSRFERAASYLAEFRPELPKPSESEARKISLRLSHLKITQIPGYHNLAEFSKDHPDAIQKALNLWQIRDGFINQSWIFGLKGSSSLEPAQLEMHIKKIVQQFRDSPKPVFLMLQYPGIVAHSYLLLGVRDMENGYQLEVADSNYPGDVGVQNYYKGSSSLKNDGDHFVPYVGFNRDFKRVHTRRDEYCAQQSELASFD